MKLYCLLKIPCLFGYICKKLLSIFVNYLLKRFCKLFCLPKSMLSFPLQVKKKLQFWREVRSQSHRSLPQVWGDTLTATLIKSQDLSNEPTILQRQEARWVLCILALLVKSENMRGLSNCSCLVKGIWDRNWSRNREGTRIIPSITDEWERQKCS